MDTVQDQIVRDIEINAPITKVWQAVTQPEHLGTWFGDSGATVDFRVGGEMKLVWKEHGEALCLIEEIDEPYRFAWRWSIGSDDKPGIGNSTLIVFTLEEAGSVTKLRVVESGFTKLGIPAEDQAKHQADNTGGWHEEIAELKTYVESLAA